VIVLGIETSTPQTSLALGSSEAGTIGAVSLRTRRQNHEVVLPALQELLAWTDTELTQVAGIAVGVGPGLFTGMRVGIEIGKSLAQVLGAPIVAVPSLDILAFAARSTARTIASVIDARRGEVFFCLYRPVPGGVTRIGEFRVCSPQAAAAELEALGAESLLVGDGATLYRREFEELGAQVAFAPQAQSHPEATVLVELALPRFEREEHDTLFDVSPLYLRKSDAEIAWDQRAGSA
jgi:tRNA threonylcarbamoyladenosine biosynthesis protein TsaB